jgi:hypothetical protein
MVPLSSLTVISRQPTETEPLTIIRETLKVIADPDDVPPRKRPRTLTSKATISPVEFATSLLLKSGLCPEAEIKKMKSARLEDASLSEPSPADEDAVSATETNDLGRIQSLHAVGHSLDHCGRFGESLLHIACTRGHLEMTKFLIREAKCSLDVRNTHGRSPLHNACLATKPNFALLTLLIEERSSHLCLPDYMGKTPLEYLTCSYWEELYPLLVEPGTLRIEQERYK